MSVSLPKPFLLSPNKRGEHDPVPMEPDPYFRHDAGGPFVPTDICRGPWDPETLHGRVVSALMAYEVDRAWGQTEFHPARFTVDLYRVPRFAPVEVSSRVVRDGNRIKVIDAEFTSNGESIARASAILLRRTDQPEGNVWSPPPWDVPSPDSLPQPTNALARMWETRTIDHGFGTVERKRAWLRETHVLVAGVALTPFVRAAFAADFTNPFANSGDAGLKYVNADITLYLHRLPVGEWLGFEVTSHHSHDGIAVGECTLHDLQGAIGTSTVTGVSNQRRGESGAGPAIPRV
jgi:Thioesterase-like superfamily